MATNVKKRSFTEGPLFFKMILFALPIIATGLLQTMYTMADNIVVGRFSGDDTALGSVGSTTALTSLSINLLIGISAGASVVISQAYGAKQDRMVSRAVRTALTFALVGGIAFMTLGLILSKLALTILQTETTYFEGALLYYRLICIGIPATAIYNFGAAILRSVGDSKTPLIVLSTTGLVNVGFNFFFVVACGMSVAGVAIATVISQYLSAIAVVLVLIKNRSKCYGFSFKTLCFDWNLFVRILRYGVPSGLQSSLFSISNMLLVSSINQLAVLENAAGELVYTNTIVTANTISSNVDALTFVTCNSFHHAAMTFVGQNYGARKPDRIKRVIPYALMQVTVFGIAMSVTELLCSNFLISLFIDPELDPATIELIAAQAKDIMQLLLTFYFLCGVMDVLSGVAKGLGYSFTPMIMSLVGICGLRVFWVFVVFPNLMSPTGLLACYPVSWSTTIALLAVLVLVALRQKVRPMDKGHNGSLPQDTEKELLEAEAIKEETV